MKKIHILILIIAISFLSCKKHTLDSIAYPSLKTDKYLFEDYTGDTELELPSSYSVEEDKINLIKIKSHSSEDGNDYNIYAVYIGDLSTIANDTVIVYCHGQANNMDYYWSRAKLLAFTGHKYRYGVLMMDYRGYGMSEGEPTEVGLTEDVNACLKWLNGKGVNKNNTVIYGFSLGTVPATEIAGGNTNYLPSKLILESPMASVEYLTQSSTVINVSSKFVSSLDFNNAETIKKVKIPFCWFHGKDDDYVNVTNGQLIFDNYTGPYKESHVIDGAKHGHNGVPENMGLENYLNAVCSFILYH